MLDTIITAATSTTIVTICYLTWWIIWNHEKDKKINMKLDRIIKQTK